LDGGAVGAIAHQLVAAGFERVGRGPRSRLCGSARGRPR
jgi:hypothetical protein